MKMKKNKTKTLSVYLSFKREVDNKKESKQEICSWNIKNENPKQNKSVFYKSHMKIKNCTSKWKQI